MVSPLIDAHELGRRLDGGAAPTVLDVRWSLTGPPGRGRFDSGHVPTAQFVDLESELSGARGSGGRHPLPAPDVFLRVMRERGVCDDRGVVVYDQNDGTAAARAWWLLRHYGHRDVRLLDGGLDAWRVAGLPEEHRQQPVGAGDFRGTPGHRRVVSAVDVGDLADRGMLLDARAEARYRGDNEPIDPVAGHIPGAVSAPASRNTSERGQFRSAAELRARFADLLGGAEEVGVYCGSGVTAAQQVLALEIAGVDAALYPGSWSEWCADPSRPVATG